MAITSSSFEEYESELRTWTDRLKVVDSLLDRPSATLIRELRRVTEEANAAEKGPDEAEGERNPWRVASTIDKRGRGDRAPLLVHAICCSVVQRLWTQRRRFAWLDEDALKPLVADLTKPFLKLEEDSGNDVFRLIDSLADDVFGAGNALAAAEIFWVLIKTGEKQAHGPLGFYCLFAMLWSLGRGAALSPADGAKMEPWRPSALVTAKCLFPLRRLTVILHQRAKLYAAIAAAYERLQKSRNNSTQRERWLFVTALEALSSHLHEFASVAVNPDDYNEAARKLAARAAPITPDFDRTRLEQLFAMTTTYLGRLLVDSANAAGPALDRAQVLLKDMEEKIVAVLDDSGNPESRRELLNHAPQLGPLKNDAAYWAQHFEAARKAINTCNSACNALQKGVAEGRRHDGDTVHSAALLESLQTLSDVNVSVAELIEVAVDASTHWMRRTLTQEVAYASAGNDTDFDAAELLSAVTIVQRWHRISDLEVEDALKWSLKSARGDGSWNTGQPIFLKHRMLGVWPSTPEVVWLLAMAVERKKKIRVADDTLIDFVTWLDKTRIELAWATPGKIAEYTEESGWPSETREHDTIDLWSTALSINALLSIRDLIEERLWTLCEKRFFVQKPRSTLETIDPVDLGAKHEARLHHRLMRMARDTTGDNYKNADYALVLHGPPGSSKTALAEALANAMWVGSRQARLVRITPADFTRQGEERVDSEARFIFDLLSHIRGATIFFDEIDQLLQRRSPGDPLSFLKLVVPAMLNRLQDLRDAAPRQEICFVFATNFVDMIDPALTRPGRIDAAVPVPYPDPWSRENVMERVFGKRKPLDERQKRRVINKTNGWPWSTFQKLCKEIRERPPRHVREIDLPIERRQADFEESENYYGNPARWESGSRPFARELAHATFAFSKNEDVCRAKLEEILDRVKPKIDVISVFKTEWATADHRSSIAGDEAELWQTVDGATARTSGMTLRSNGSAEFRVWAPFALQVAVAGTFNEWSRSRHELSRDPDFPGFWKGTIAGVLEFPPPAPEPVVKLPQAEVPELEDAAVTSEEEKPEPVAIEEPPVQIPQYRYVVTMDTVEQLLRSDPFSYELIDVPAFSVHNSVFVTPPEKDEVAPFTPASLETLVIYQLHPATFSSDGGGPGTLRSAVTRLDELKALGVNAVEILMLGDRLYDRPWGYDAEFPLAIRTSSGGAAAMRDFIAQAHARGMAVIAGVRWHNIGRWVESATDAGIMKRHVADGGLWQFDGWPADENDGGIYYKGSSFVLELAQREVRDYLLECALRWILDMHVDGLRWNDVGAVLAMDRVNAPDLLTDVLCLLNAMSLITIAQDDDERPESIDDFGFVAMWRRSFMEKMHSVLHKSENESFDLKVLAAQISGDVDPVSRILYSESYREAEHGRFPRQSGHDFTRRRRAMFGAILVFTSAGTPMIFQGQEDLADGVFGPDVMFDGTRDEAMRRFYTDLIRLRTGDAATRGLRGPSSVADADQELIWIHRTNENDRALVVLNFSGNYLNRNVPVPVDGDWHVHLNTADRRYGPEGTDGGSSGKLVAHDGSLRIEVDRWSALILAHSAPRP